jgi:16S rRNA (guanine966-N2)-methyltransferase
MRVIAGKWRGRNLQSPRGASVRPTTDRVKEAMFSILGPDLQGALLIDVCCGSGGLAAEALSRGAKQVILVDSSRKSLDTARRNLELCGAQKSEYELVCSDARTWLNSWPLPGTPFFLVGDPPYQSDLPEILLDWALQAAAVGRLHTGIVEHAADLDPGEIPAGTHLRVRRYGQSHLTIVRPASPAADNDEVQS